MKYASRRKPRARPPQVETGFIDIVTSKVESTVTKTSWGGAKREEVVRAEMNQFVAYALGPEGRYEAARSQMFKPEGGFQEGAKQRGRILNEFLASLMQDGWVVTPPGRRQATSYRSWMMDGDEHNPVCRELGPRRAVIA